MKQAITLILSLGVGLIVGLGSATWQAENKVETILYLENKISESEILKTDQINKLMTLNNEKKTVTELIEAKNLKAISLEEFLNIDINEILSIELSNRAGNYQDRLNELSMKRIQRNRQIENITQTMNEMQGLEAE